jgi:large subunit ribosomal protein L1
MKHGKAYRAAAEAITADQLYSPEEALGITKKGASAKFDETIEVALRLGVDPRKADQMVRGTVNLPNGTGKTARVLVFATGEKANDAIAAGADEVGADELIEKIAGGYLDFDAVVATPDLMGKVGRLGRVLGPRGLMPNPKVGTVTPDVAGAVKNAKAGQVRYRTDKGGIIHCTIGKADFQVDQLRENLQALLTDLNKLKPSSSKGVYMKKITVSTTMGPGLAVDQATLGL